MTSHYKTLPGNGLTGGVTFTDEGVNFCVFSQIAERIELLLFETADDTVPFQVIELNSNTNRTFMFWHVLVIDLPDGTYYNWRVYGPNDTITTGSRIDSEKALLDPWATVVSDSLWQRNPARDAGDNTDTALRAIVLKDHYDWEDDEPYFIPLGESVIYEMHVRGFTRHDSSGVKHPGSFSGVVEKIPYLKSLGITHVELMPVMAFDNQDVPDKTASLGNVNYWGYSTHSFFAPHPQFAVEHQNARDEFRDMVKALHRAGIAVILDVVFNHTSEAGADGPTISFKALGNEIFYHLDATDKRIYRDYTGCGNTVNCNHPLVTRFLMDALRYWVEEMHVDGFRFDLASAMARGEDGHPQYHAPMLWNTEFSPHLRKTHLIAEAWDAAGLNQLGDFPGFRWAEWNGRYRDVIRAFVRGDEGWVNEVATRICGSSDMYNTKGRMPWNSINFITCHDGYTLWDLVSYESKHNLANGEDNRDGHNHNLSANYGVEGPTDDPAINQLRLRQVKNFMAILLLSQGVPMIHGGDEILASKQGNNNSFCQDNQLSWQNWQLVEKNKDMLQFVTGMIQLRRRQPTLTRSRFLTGQADGSNNDNQDKGNSLRDIAWHGTQLDAPPWHDPAAKHLSFTLTDPNTENLALHVIFNMHDTEMDFAIPVTDTGHWHIAVNTANDPAIFTLQEQPLTEAKHLTAAARSVIVLEFKPR